MNQKYLGNANKIKLAPKKASRIVGESSKPSIDNFTYTGFVAPNKLKTFTFKIVSASQQMRERNSAYNFFSID